MSGTCSMEKKRIPKTMTPEFAGRVRVALGNYPDATPLSTLIPFPLYRIFIPMYRGRPEDITHNHPEGWLSFFRGLTKEERWALVRALHAGMFAGFDTIGSISGVPSEELLNHLPSPNINGRKPLIGPIIAGFLSKVFSAEDRE